MAYSGPVIDVRVSFISQWSKESQPTTKSSSPLKRAKIQLDMRNQERTFYRTLHYFIDFQIIDLDKNRTHEILISLNFYNIHRNHRQTRILITVCLLV